MKRPGVPVPARGGLKEGMPAGRWRRRVLKRFWILIVVLALLPLSGCKKSEGIKIENFFGAPPTVSEVSLTKERRDAECIEVIDLCLVTCLPDTVTEKKVSIDLVTASAKVVDPTPADGTTPTDILVVVLRFLDPPPETGSTQVKQYSLEMFDTGLVTVGTIDTDKYSRNGTRKKPSR